MVKLTPDPPLKLTTSLYPFGPCAGDLPLLAVREGMPVEEALIQACEYLKSASAVATEVVESSPPALRDLARSVEHSVAGLRPL